MGKSKSDKKNVRCHYCGEVVLNDDLVYKEIWLNSKTRKLVIRPLHHFCVPKIVDDMKVTSEVKQEEHTYWDKCYDLFRDWLGTPRILEDYAIARLQGLRIGKHSSKGENVMGVRKGYEYDVIYTTMAYCSNDVRHALNTVIFKDNKHKVNYIMKILESNIGTIYAMIVKKRKASQKLDNKINQIASQSIRNSQSDTFEHLRSDISNEDIAAKSKALELAKQDILNNEIESDYDFEDDEWSGWE